MREKIKYNKPSSLKFLALFYQTIAVFDIVGKINFSKNCNMRSNSRILKLPRWKSSSKKVQLLIPWDLRDFNIQTSKSFFGGCFLL
jgi:hypothetical protein